MSVNIKRQEIGTLKEVLFGEEISPSSPLENLGIINPLYLDSDFPSENIESRIFESYIILVM